MQIGENIYIDIEVENMNVTNFINYDDMRDCKIIETAGASLPYVYIKFLTTNEKIMNSIQLGNKVKLSIGNTASNKDTFTLDLLPAQPNKESSGVGWVIELTGFIGNKEYMINQISKSYLGNSLLVVNQVMKEELGIEVINDFASANENQVNWMRTNKTAATFVSEVLTHSDLRPSFPLFAFDKFGNFYIKDITKLVKEGPKYIFSSSTPTVSNGYQYFNNFNPRNYKNTYNLYSGYNKVTEIYNSTSGQSRFVMDENVPILASSSEAEESYAGNIVKMNDIQSDNVHKTYQESFVFNTNKLMALSSYLGCLTLLGDYHRELKPLDLIEVFPEGNEDSSFSGRYLIDSIVTECDFYSGGIRTLVFVTRDNKNNVENYNYTNYSITQLVATPINKGLDILKEKRDKLLSVCSLIKTVYAMSLSFMDGSFLRKLFNIAIETKINLLRSFRINNIIQDMTSSQNELVSLILGGNSLMNSLIDLLFPQEVYTTFKDFLIDKPSAKDLLVTYIYESTPVDILDVVLIMVDSIYDLVGGLNSIARDNNIYIGKGGSTVSIASITSPTQISYAEERQPQVNLILESFENNTTGLDIPFPRIVLTESEALLPNDKLKDLIADKTIENLDNLQYLEGVDKEEFKKILLGQQIIDFNIINKINKSAGDNFYYRYWGIYNDTLDLNSFTIKKSFKDKYRTIPCTKILSVTDNKKIFFCCPKKEEDLKFYINSRRIELSSFEIDLGYVDIYKIPIPYVVYYTEIGYNSNSVLFEVKQRTMV